MSLEYLYGSPENLDSLKRKEVGEEKWDKVVAGEGYLSVEFVGDLIEKDFLEYYAGVAAHLAAVDLTPADLAVFVVVSVCCCCGCC